jgi:hypothetical protein
MPFLLPPLPPDLDRGGGRAALAGGAPGAAAAGDRGKRRGRRGGPSPIPTLGSGALEGGSTAGGGLLAVVAGAALVVAMEGSAERKKWLWTCGVPRRAA